jgi:hypothetical protein
MATLLETLETTCASLSRKVRFEYAGDLEEANATIFDKITSGQFPVCLVLAFDIVDNDRAHARINSTAEVNAIFLDRINQPSIDKPTTETETKVIAPMRALAREFVNRLETTDIISEDGITSVNNRSVYQAMMDAHLYGCWSVFTIKFSEDINTHICD